MIPLGGFVTIPGMHRPIPHDAERRFARAVEEAPALGSAADRVKLRSRATTSTPRVARSRHSSRLSVNSRSHRRRHLGAEGDHRARGRARSRRILEGPHVEAARRDRGGAGANIALTVVLFTFLFLTVAGRRRIRLRRSRRRSRAGSSRPRRRWACRPVDRVVAINGKPVVASEIAETIAGSGGKPLTLTVVRHGDD